MSKVFNLISRTNETRYIKCNETCKHKCRLDASVCNNKKRCNEHKARSCMIKYLFGFLEIVSANMINLKVLENV